MSTDIIERLHQRPMGRYQILIVAICVALNMLDGFDVLAMAFAAPGLREDWSLPADQLGLLLSAGLFGMTIGSIFISPLSDRFGRRPVIVLCTLDMAIAMWLSAFAQNVPELLALRVVTGLGLGGLLASMNSLVAEYTPDHRRDFAVSIMVVGYALGAAVGGLAAVPLVERFGWPAVFIVGGAGASIMFPLVYLFLPESLDLLLARRGRNVLAKVNAVLKRLGEPVLAELPPAAPAERDGVGIAEFLKPNLLRSTLLFCASFFLLFVTNIFFVSWTPTILRDLGLSVSNAIFASLLMHCGAVTGGIVIGALANRFGLRLLTPVYMVMMFVVSMSFAILSGPLWLLLAISVLIGFFGNGSSTALYAIAPRIFSARLRTTGTGLAIGCGRLGGIVSPYVAGVLMGLGWERAFYCLVLVLPVLISAVLVPLIREVSTGQKIVGKGAVAQAARP